MIPLCLLTGFLGSGKTTLLKRLVDHLQGKRIAYVVNEFSSLDVDTKLLGVHNPSIISIPGGSIFCKCLVSEFIKQMNAIATMQPPFEGLVIEASGMSDPRVIQKMLVETRLDKHFSISSIISVADPSTLIKLIHTLPAVKAQIEASDTIILNKIDRAKTEAITKSEEIIRSINPTIRMIQTTYANIELDIFNTQPIDRTLNGDLALCRDPHFFSAAITLDKPLNEAALGRTFTLFKDRIYRAKGFAIMAGKTVYVDWSLAGLSITSITPTLPVEYGLAVIFKGDDEKLEAELTAALSNTN